MTRTAEAPQARATQFDHIPLSGAPAVSANCWNELEREIVQARCRSFLEWGSGNSTIRLLNQKRDRALPDLRQITSIENDLPFYLRMVEEAREVLQEIAAPRDLEVTHRVYRNVVDSETWAKRKQLEAASVRYQQAIGGFKDPGAAYQKYRRRGGILRYFAHVIMSLERLVARDVSFLTRRVTDAVLARPDSTVAWTPGYPSNIANGRCVHTRFEAGDVILDYLLVPKLSRSPKILDGLYSEYATYVNAPVSPDYDAVFIDGRARVSCMKRVVLDGLLSEAGLFFLHDAHGFHMKEGLALFPGGFFLNGNVVLIDGTDFSHAFPTTPVQAGEKVEATRPTNLREMFVYRRGAQESRIPASG